MGNELALGYVFGLGMVAVFNPCGFAMLPAWIAYFLASDDDETDANRSVLRSLLVGGVLTAGFVAVFLVLGVVIQLTTSSIVEKLPWFSIVAGIAMVVLAGVLATGRELRVPLPFVVRAPRSRSLPSVFGFGVSYAFISLACTIPLFLATVTTSLTGGSPATGILHFVAYACGMGVILTALTVALSLAQATSLRRVRRILPHIRRLAAVLLGLAGAYVAYYGWYQLEVYDGNTDAGGPAQVAYDLSARMADLITTTGSVRIGLLAALGVSGSALIAFLNLRARRPPPRSQPEGETRPQRVQP
ncbi:MAG: cytochrome c biogenesis CcdA family protein [Acidimicrobiales bacterium]|jgi:cytochrome c biogenesis protein CcdA|nr:cytochrome c biogenesis CcdA family protein [Acidimicrobiales bacterium]